MATAPAAVSPEPVPESLATLQATNATLRDEVRYLKLRLQALERQLWGRSSERTRPGDATAPLDLFAADPRTGEGQPPLPDAPTLVIPRSAAPRAAKGPKPLSPTLPRTVIPLPDPAPDTRVCPLTGEPLVPVFTEQCEVLARQPACYFVKRFERTVWGHPLKTTLVSTPWPADVWPRAHMDISVVAHLATAHYVEHQPFYRLERQLARHGVTLARPTQCSLMDQLETRVTPLVARLQTRVLHHGYVQLDATPIPVCDPARPGQVCEATVWAFRAIDPATGALGLTWYHWARTKAIDGPRQILDAVRYQGLLQTDGAAGLSAIGPPGTVHLGCWAHARRHLRDAEALGEPGATRYRVAIDQLFQWDREGREHARAQEASPADQQAARTTWRTQHSIPLMRAVFAWATAELPTLPPKMPLGKALAYLLSQRASLERCVTLPEARLDNNGAENAIRPLKLGVKNWLAVGHPDAGWRCARLFTVLENCRQAGIDPEAYLIAVVPQLQGPLSDAQLDVLLPDVGRPTVPVALA